MLPQKVYRRTSSDTEDTRSIILETERNRVENSHRQIFSMILNLIAEHTDTYSHWALGTG